MTDDEKAQAEAASWRAWQTAWGNTESGAHAHGWENGYQAGFDAGQRAGSQSVSVNQFQNTYVPEPPRSQCIEQGAASLHYVKRGEAACGCPMRYPAPEE